MNKQDVKVLSQIPGDVMVIKAVYEASQRDLTHEYKCRGRIVYRTNMREQTERGVYVYCQFADTGQFAWINAKNLREKALAVPMTEAA